MASKKPANQANLYIGVDVGGTKIQASVLTESGLILARHRRPTPRETKSKNVLKAIITAIEEVVDEQKLKTSQIAGIGVVAPGVVDPDKGKVLFAPNLDIAGLEISEQLKKQFNVKTALGNDCNLGTLGEKWLGTGRNAKSVVGLFPGTGMGGGYVLNGQVFRGSRESAMEIGHIVMQVDGPKCACGMNGCFEALASRSAIEKTIREKIQQGKKSIITELLDGDLSIIKSGTIKEAIEANDKLTCDIIKEASRIIGLGCINIRHILDPEMIVLGGGLIEACGDFMYPIICETVDTDPLPGTGKGGEIFIGSLGDDAVVLGAVALARIAVDKSPFDAKYKTVSSNDMKPELEFDPEKGLVIEEKVYSEGAYIRVNGRVRKRVRDKGKERFAKISSIGTEELKKICKGGPELVLFASSKKDEELNSEAQNFLKRRCIESKILSIDNFIKEYNNTDLRKAAAVYL